MHLLNEIQITQNLRLLIKDDADHTQEELELKWLGIQDERLSYQKDNRAKRKLKQAGELEYMQYYLDVLINIQTVYKTEGMPKWVLDELDEVLKNIKIKDLDLKIRTLTDKINRKTPKDNNVAEEVFTFEEALAVMRVNQYQVDRNMTVAEWDALVERVNIESSKLKNKANK